MKREINEDILGYQNDFFKGLSLRECIFGVVALVAGVGTMLVLIFIFHVWLNIAVTIGVPIIAMIGLCGFYHKNDMTLAQYWKARRRVKKSKPLVYATETLQETERDNSHVENVGMIEKMLIKMQKKKG